MRGSRNRRNNEGESESPCRVHHLSSILVAVVPFAKVVQKMVVASVCKSQIIASAS